MNLRCLAFLIPVTCLAGPAESVDQIMATWIKPDSAGCSIGVMKDGKTVLERGYGMANLEHKIPNAANTAFYLGSTSKEFTALAVLMLVEQGKLKLDDPIRKYLPDLPAYMQPVTIRHLLEHTSGIRDYYALWTLSGPPEDAYLSVEKVMEIVHRQKALNFTPGTEFLYSNTGYFLLSIILGPAAFSNLPELARNAIFEPLGMRDTFYYMNHFALLPRRATGYTLNEKGDVAINTATLDIAGDGGVFTTVSDTMKWLAFLDQPKGGLAKPFERMRQKGKLASGGTVEYGMGLMLKRYRGLETYSHVGGLRGYRSEIFYMPAQRVGVVCYCNNSSIQVGPITRMIAEVFMKDPPHIAVAEVSAADLKKKMGMFRDRDSGDMLAIVTDGANLQVQYQGYQMMMVPEEPMRFRSVNSPLDFELEFRSNGAQDEPKFVRIESESHKPSAYERMDPKPVQLENPKQYEGEYFSAEANAKFKVQFWESQLSVEQNNQKIGNLSITGKDRFSAGTMNFEFTRNTLNQVQGFRLNTGRVRGLTFDRVSATP